MRTLVPIAVALLGGCASVPREAGFGDVQKTLAERSALRVHWNQGTEADRPVAERIGSLLAAPLTADAAVEVALLNNRRLQAVYEDLSVAQGDLVQAGLLRNPTLHGEVRFAVDGAGTGAHLGLEQSFIDLLVMPLRKRLARASFEAAKLRVAGAVVDHAADTRAAFYAFQAAGQLQEMRATVFAAMEASYDLSKRLHAAGNITDLDLALERMQYEDAKVDLAAAELETALARTQLDTLMGVFGAAAAWHAAARLPALLAEEIDLAGLERRAIVRSLDLGAIRQEIIAAGERAGLARVSRFLPDLDIGIESEREPEGQWTVGPGLAVPVPIFDQGQAAVATFEARLRQSRELAAVVAVEVRAAVRAARARLLASRDRVEYFQKVILPLREEIVAQTQLQYNAMQVGGFRLLDARREQVEAGARYIREIHEYWTARTELERILNGRMRRIEIPDRGSLAESSTRWNGM